MGLEKAFKIIDREKKWITDLLADMVRIPTVSPSGEKYEEFVTMLAEKLASRGLEAIVHRVPQSYVDDKCPPEAKGNPRYIVMIRLGKGSETLHFNGHYDVVPGGPGWSVTEPFKPLVRDGRMYGRGTTDMKGGLASMVAAMLALAEVEEDLGMRVEAAFVPDEEIGGKCGSGYIVERMGLKPDYVIIAEPSSINRIWIGHKGAVRAEIIVKGKTAHSSTPWLGVNAFKHMVYVAKEFFEELVPRVESRRSRYRFDEPGGERATMMLGGVVRGGGKINQVPGEASFTIDRRVIPEEKAEDAWREIVGFVDKLRAKGYDVEAKLLGISDAVVTDPDNLLVKAMREAVREVVGIEPMTTVCIGGLDLRYYVTAGSTGISYGPGVPNTAHAPNENIVLEDVFTVAKTYVLLPWKLSNAK